MKRITTFKNKTAVWTNYDAALFAKDAQIQFYRDVLVQGAVIQVSGTGIIVDDTDKQYKPKLIIQDARLGFTNSDGAVGTQQQPKQNSYNQAQQQGGFQQQQQPQQNQYNQAQQGGFNQQQQNPHNYNG